MNGAGSKSETNASPGQPRSTVQSQADSRQGQERAEPEAPVDLGHIDSDSLPSEEDDDETPGGEEAKQEKGKE